MGPASCAAMTTGSLSGGRRCPSERAGGALLGEGPGGRWGAGAAAASGWPPLPPPPPGAAAPDRAVLCAYLSFTARAQPPPTTGSPLRGGAALLLRVSPESSLLPGRPDSLGIRDVPANTLDPALRPRKCRAAAKPRPACVDGIVQRRPPGLARCPAVPRLCPRALMATLGSLLVLVGTCPRDGSAAPLGRRAYGAAPSLTLGASAWPDSAGGNLASWNPEGRVVTLDLLLNQTWFPLPAHA